MKIGYARVSTPEQKLNLQLDALRNSGCKKIFHDVASGASAARKGLAACLDHLREGDKLVVWKLDRLGRTLRQLMDFVSSLEERGIQFQCLTEGIDTTTPGGKFFFHLMGAFAQMERELIRERTRAGLATARARGRTGGRPRAMDPEAARAAATLLSKGTPVKNVAAMLKVSPATLYRSLARLFSDEPKPIRLRTGHPV